MVDAFQLFMGAAVVQVAVVQLGLKYGFGTGYTFRAGVSSALATLVISGLAALALVEVVDYDDLLRETWHPLAVGSVAYFMGYMLGDFVFFFIGGDAYAYTAKQIHVLEYSFHHLSFIVFGLCAIRTTGVLYLYVLPLFTEFSTFLLNVRGLVKTGNTFHAVFSLLFAIAFFVLRGAVMTVSVVPILTIVADSTQPWTVRLGFFGTNLAYYGLNVWWGLKIAHMVARTLNQQPKAD